MELTDSSQRGGGGGDCMKEGEGISQRTCMHDHGHRQPSGDSQGRGGSGKTR